MATTVEEQLAIYLTNAHAIELQALVPETGPLPFDGHLRFGELELFACERGRLRGDLLDQLGNAVLCADLLCFCHFLEVRHLQRPQHVAICNVLSTLPRSTHQKQEVFRR